MTDIINIPLNKLILWTGNVRKTRSKTAVDKLAASIKVHGLQQRSGRSSRARRRQEIQCCQLPETVGSKPCSNSRVKAGDIAGDIRRSLCLAVSWKLKTRYRNQPCRERHAGRHAPRRPVRGIPGHWPMRACPVTDIAARFGSSEVHVQKLPLKLARVSTKIIKA